jgi:hypothetical protein
MTSIQGGLFSPNLFIANQTLATQMRTTLSQHFTKFNKFFTRSYQNPMSYFELYALFSELNGTVDAVFMFADAIKNTLVSYDLPYMKEILTKLVAQDNRFFIKETSTNKTVSKKIFFDILNSNSTTDFLKVSLSKFTASQIDFFQNLTIVNDMLKNRYI